MSQHAPRAGDEVPSIFDEDDDDARVQRRRELRRIRSVLFTTALLILLPSLLGVLLPGAIESQSGLFWGYALAVVGAYALLGAFALSKPFTALLIGLGAYLVLQAAIILGSPVSLYHGWMFRIIILLNLLMPLRRAQRLQDESSG